jgi:hypothetical protein
MFSIGPSDIRLTRQLLLVKYPPTRVVLVVLGQAVALSNGRGVKIDLKQNLAANILAASI